jgi:DNA polymerase-3 subunit epsilon
LLADVYLAMTRGQNSLVMENDSGHPGDSQNAQYLATLPVAEVLILRANVRELSAHESWLDGLERGGKNPSIWRNTP